MVYYSMHNKPYFILIVQFSDYFLLIFYSGKSFFSNLNTPIINVTIAIPARIANFQAKLIVPFNIETVSKSEIMEK